MKMKTYIKSAAAFILILMSFLIVLYALFTDFKQSRASHDLNIGKISAKQVNSDIEAFLREKFIVADQLSINFLNLQQSNLDFNRDIANRFLKDFLEKNTNFLGVWTIWEPEAFDGKDSLFINKEYHDNTGRFIPYFMNYGGEISCFPCLDYEKKGSYYNKVKNSGKKSLIEPMSYNIGNRDLLVSSIEIPLKNNNKFVGVVGIDFEVDPVKSILAKYDNYSFVLTDSDKKILYGRDNKLHGIQGKINFLNKDLYKDNLLKVSSGYILKNIIDTGTEKSWVLYSFIETKKITNEIIFKYKNTIICSGFIFLLIFFAFVFLLRKNLGVNKLTEKGAVSVKDFGVFESDIKDIKNEIDNIKQLIKEK